MSQDKIDIITILIGLAVLVMMFAGLIIVFSR